jgi:hypothetical protein
LEISTLIIEKSILSVSNNILHIEYSKIAINARDKEKVSVNISKMAGFL